jgi:hypothetical protein
MYRGLFINLDRNEARREQLTRDLADCGAAARYERFAAVDGHAAAAQHPTELDPGSLGLWLTHERLLEAHRDSDLDLHVIEDDVSLAGDVVARIDETLGRAHSEQPDWDVIWTEMFVPVDTAVYLELTERLVRFHKSRHVQLYPLDRIDFAGTTSMLINRRAVGKYADLISGNWRQGHPIDLFLRDRVQGGDLRALVTVPFLTTLSRQNTESDIRGAHDRSRRVWDTYRRSFFIAADLGTLLNEMTELTRNAKAPQRATIFCLAHLFAMSDQYERF